MQRADINGDGVVNSFDLSILLGQWGSDNTAADINQDGVVNAFDLSILLTAWGPVVGDDDPIPTTMMSSVSRHGITWFFDKEYPCGQFVNGDWFVIGPVTIVNTNPAPGVAPADEINDLGPNKWGDTGLRDDKTRRNGSMVVMGVGSTHGYDSRGVNYNASQNISFPFNLPIDRTIVSCESNRVIPTQVMHHDIMWSAEKITRAVMKSAAVLTCFSEAPPVGSFRPAYAGGNKRLFNVKDIRWDRLRSLSLPSGQHPSWSRYERYLERTWLDHLNGTWTGQWLLPSDNQPSYGRENARIISMASLMIHLDVPQSQKETLTLRLIQLGIDLRGTAELGGRWNAGGGHTSGRKWPILLAGLLLDNNYFLNMPSTALFHEDTQTYYGAGWHGQTALWQMISHHGARQPYLHVHPSQWGSHDGGWGDASESYRVCCNAIAWGGQALSALLMGAKSVWNHNAFFDVVDDWMRVEDIYADKRSEPRPTRPSQEGSAFSPWDDFVTHMWAAHRHASVPAQADGNLQRMWNAVEGRWVPNVPPQD